MNGTSYYYSHWYFLKVKSTKLQHKLILLLEKWERRNEFKSSQMFKQTCKPKWVIYCNIYNIKKLGVLHFEAKKNVCITTIQYFYRLKFYGHLIRMDSID